MRYSYEMNCATLFASITVAVVIQLDCAGGAPRLNLHPCRLVPLSVLIDQLLSPTRSLPSVFLCLPKPFLLFSSTCISSLFSPLTFPVPLSSSYLSVLCLLYFHCPPPPPEETSISFPSPPLPLLHNPFTNLPPCHRP